jgi:hypothetical protein
VSVYYGSFVESGYHRAVVVSLDPIYRVLFYEDGTVRFEHSCDRGDRGVIDCAPALQIGSGHSIVSEDPLTITPSILCADCGTHGFVRDGRWVQ